jgi:hypothetical protein
MIMFDHSRRLAEPLRWGRREKAAVGAVLACAVIALAGLGVFALTSGSPARRDCVDLTFASTVGAATLHACGAQARRVCAAGGRGIEAELRSACRRAGFPYKPRS